MTEYQSPIRILIADDHLLLRSALCALFKDEPDFMVVGEAIDSAQAIELADELKPDILLLDVSMPRNSGMTVLRELSGSQTPRVILFTAGIEKSQVDEAFRLGARGLVVKDAAVDVLFQSIRSVMAGDYWLKNKAASSL